MVTSLGGLLILQYIHLTHLSVRAHDLHKAGGLHTSLARLRCGRNGIRAGLSMQIGHMTLGSNTKSTGISLIATARGEG